VLQAFTTRHALVTAATMLAWTACAPAPADRGGGGTGAEYVAAAEGEVDFSVGCEDWRSIPDGNRVWLEDPASAEDAGYRAAPAAECAPPESRRGLAPEESGVCTVERVVDGDTLVCREAGERVRLLLIDTPELAQRPYGELARSELQRILPRGASARLELDLEPRDRYGRLLAYVFAPDGTMANEHMARQGYAVVISFPPNLRHIDRIRAAVAEARAAGRGLWRGSAFDCMPADHRAGRCP
jgi:micrococcal nuclease